MKYEILRSKKFENFDEEGKLESTVYAFDISLFDRIYIYKLRYCFEENRIRFPRFETNKNKWYNYSWIDFTTSEFAEITKAVIDKANESDTE